MFNNIYKNKKVLVTGHTGFKGSWLCTWLKMLGAEVCGYSLEPNTEPSLYKALGLGEKISKFSKVLELTSSNVLIIVCSDSYAANELYYVKTKLLENMNEKVKNLGIEIKDIKFDYKKWKEQEYDK